MSKCDNSEMCGKKKVLHAVTTESDVTMSAASSRECVCTIRRHIL